MTRTSFALLKAALVLAAASWSPPAEAAPEDGVYGRLDGDLDLSIAAGVGVAKGGALGSVLGRAIFVDTAGIYATYADAFDKGRPLSRSFSVGVELRPLFLARWANGLEVGPPILDLTLDSLALHLGTFWTSPAHPSSASTPGFELGAGFEIPLFRQASGPWIGARGSLRWGPSDFAGGSETAAERGAIAFFTLSWHGRVTSRIADAGDILKR